MTSSPSLSRIRDESTSHSNPPKARLSTKASRQRSKPQLSCNFCRVRKFVHLSVPISSPPNSPLTSHRLKCDRQNPCQNCTKRDLSSSCTYMHASSHHGSSSVHKASAGSTGPGGKDAQARLKHLEELVVTLMQQNAFKATPSVQVPDDSKRRSQFVQDEAEDNEQEEARKRGEKEVSTRGLIETEGSFGRMTVESEQPTYVGAAHWAAILESIAGLKDSLEDTQKPPETHEETPSSANCAISKYEIFWFDPSATPITWIGLLFSILCLSLNIEVLHTNSAPSLCTLALRDPLPLIEILRQRAIQSLILGNYTEPKLYTVEALLLYFFTEHFRSLTQECHVGAWMAMGLLVRAAMRLGYHRDARHSPQISVLRGEMQRRIWATIVHMDVQTSCRVGLPRMLNEESFDTQMPSNLKDEDLWEGMKELRAERPWSQETGNTYPLIKHKIIGIYGIIVDRMAGVGSVEYKEVSRLDGMLSDLWDKIPEFLKVRSVGDLKIEDANLIVRRFSVNLCFQRARCMLHRKYLLPLSEGVERYEYSVKACVDAGMHILQSQAIVYEQSKPDRRLYAHRWKITSLMTHDFLLAAMLLCVYLNQRIGNQSSSVSCVHDGSANWAREEMLHVLEGSYRIWDEASRTSKDAWKAAKTLSRTLSKVRRTEKVTEASQERSSFSATSTNSSHRTSLPKMPTTLLDAGQALPVSVENTDALWRWSNFAHNQSLQTDEQDSFDAPFEAMMNKPFELDWDLWDSLFQNSLSGNALDQRNSDAGPAGAPPQHEGKRSMEDDLRPES
ncbi:Fusarisetin A cluster transcription factor fsa6 [Hyphodiscus hymeniophilus]|uniref:Fusarisetin A cluster transcription factor fsa6 n=1 Tax=Hyphodiscus hymeniophilus TaxID=353542 RepID=A0A9P7AVV7_9HELO|nr:Fusarisetin A cluster transcription factor fsa6 [Hyphodiscus hymeniophilus]